MSERLTKAQRLELQRAFTSQPIAGLLAFAWFGPGVGLRRAAWERMMRGMCERGLVRPYVHGGYEVTDLGRRALQGDSE